MVWWSPREDRTFPFSIRGGAAAIKPRPGTRFLTAMKGEQTGSGASVHFNIEKLRPPNIKLLFDNVLTPAETDTPDGSLSFWSQEPHLDHQDNSSLITFNVFVGGWLNYHFFTHQFLPTLLILDI